MANLPPISIIIPLYNVEAFITECLQSVAQQTYGGKIECIIIDDCGTDNSVTIAKQFIHNYIGTIEFRMLHHDNNRGLSAARNTGLNAASGEYVYFLDSDDWISDDCIEVLANRLQEHPYQIVIGDYKTFGDKEVPSLLFEKQDKLLGNDLIYHEHAERQLCVIACNKLCDISFLRKNDIQFMEGQLHEDDLWTYKVMSVAQKIAVEKKVTYHYRMRESSIMSDKKNLDRKVQSMFQTVEYILTHPLTEYKKDFEIIARTYIGKYIGLALESQLTFIDQYRFIRKIIHYHPLQLFLKGQMSLIDVKHQFHYVLSPILGYGYLMLRRRKLHK